MYAHFQDFAAETTSTGRKSVAPCMTEMVHKETGPLVKILVGEYQKVRLHHVASVATQLLQAQSGRQSLTKAITFNDN